MVKHYPYDLAQLRSKSRNKELAFVRQTAMFLMKKLTDKSLREIGIFLGGRDHSTVMHSIDKVNEMVQKDDLLRDKIERIEREIVT